jgi:uncharacterized repeat protein (TIGR01451 family)
MARSFGKLLVVLLCVLMVIGGLDLGTVVGSAADQGVTAVGREASSRAIKTFNTTTFVDWRGGTANNITVYNQSDGELKLMAFEYFTIPVPGMTGVRDLEVDSKGNLYIGTEIGTMVTIDAKTGAILDNGKAVPDEDNINRLKMDKNDTLWGGGRSNWNGAGATPNRGGILWRMSTTTRRIDADWKPEPVNGAQVRGLTADKNGTVWAGTIGGMLARVDPTTGIMTRLNGGNALLPGYGIYQLTAAQNGMIYAGTTAGPDGGHLLKIDPTTNTFTIMNNDNPLVSGDGIQAMTTALNGTIYMGTNNIQGTVIMLDPTTDKISILGRAMPGAGTVQDLYSAPDGSVYGLMGGGAVPEEHLLKIEAGTGALIDMGVPIPGAVNPGYIAVAPDGTVWGSGPNSQLFKMAPQYEKIPAARLDRPTAGRIFTENFELSDINWDTVPSPGPTNFKRVTDASRPAGDKTVFEQQDTASTAAYARAGVWGPIANNFEAFNMNPVGVMEVQFKFVGAPGGGGGGPFDVRLFMCADSYGNNYALFFDEVTNQIRLYRDWGQIGNTYNALSLDRGYWYDVKWKTYHTGTGAGAAFTVWINGTKIFNEVPINPVHHLTGAVALGTRAYDASFDNLRLYKDTNITVGGLQAGQKVSLYADNGTLLKSATAAGAAVILGLDIFSFPLSGYFNVTRTDGSTVVLTTAGMKDIYGGDSYNYVTPATSGSVWRYLSKGTFLSKPFDAGMNVTWLNIGWNGQKPANTNFSFRTRTALTMAGLALAVWSAPITVSGSAITSPFNQWFQFEAKLNTTDITKTPEIDDVSITYKAFPAFDIQITQDPPAVYPNDILVYNITYNQVGIDIAKDVWITDTLPSILTFVNSSADAVRTGSVWHFTNVPPGSHNLLVVRARVSKDATDGATIRNNASIKFTDTLDAVIGTVVAEDAVTMVLRPSFLLGLKGPATAAPGDVINYTMNYNKTGNGDAKTLWLNVTLDKNLTITGSSAEPWRTGASWHIPGNQTVETINLTAKVNSSVALGAKLKVSEVLNHTFPNDYMPAGVKAGPVETTVIGPTIDFRKTVDMATALPGDIIIYKIYFNNTGTAGGKLTVGDVLAPELELLNSSAEANRTGANWTFASVPVGSHNVLSIRTRIKNDTLENIVIKNVATGILSTAAGVELGKNNTNEVSTKVGFLPRPKITVAIVVDEAKAEWNDTVNFTIYYNNTGEDAASSVSIKEQLPKGLTYLSSDAEGNRIGNNWDFTTVPTGGHSFKVKAKVDPGTANRTVLTNQVTLNYTGPRGKDMPGSKAAAAVTVYKPGTLPPGDKTRPSITDRKPVPDATNVPTNARIEITFSKPMNKTETQRAFSITPQVSGNFSWNGNTLIFTPDKPLAKGQKYIIKIEPYAKDTVGNLINPISSWSFTVQGKSGGGNAVANWLCLGGIIALIAVILAAVGYWLVNRKKGKAPARPSTRRPQTMEEGLEEPTTLPPKYGPKPRPRPVPVVPAVAPEEEVIPEAPKEEPVEEKGPEPAMREEPPLIQEEPVVVPVQEEVGIVQEPPKPEERIVEPAREEAPVEPEEKVAEPVKEEAPPNPEEKPPEPVKEEAAEPGPPKVEPETKKEEKKPSDLDDILKKLRE